MSYIRCYDEKDKLIREEEAPFDMEINCHEAVIYGNDFSGIKLTGKCYQLLFNYIINLNDVDLSGFIDLEIDTINVWWSHPCGLLKLLELNCKKFCCYDEKFENIVNKYLQEEPDPLMRNIQGCKYELAVNGYGDRL